MTKPERLSLPEQLATPSEADRAVMADAAAALAVVIRLFDRELDRDAIAGIRQGEAFGFLGQILESGPARESLAALHGAVSDLPTVPDDATLDRLAADYADIFLTHGHRAAPSASVWLSDDHTERNEPMFEARRWYAHWGISVPNWRVRADDHIVPMLQFVAFLLEQGSAEAAADAAVFMDRQMGPWVGNFLGKVSVRADTPVYRASAAFAGALLAEIRAELTRITGIPENIPEPPKRAEVKPDEVAFLPGAAPSW